MADNKNSAEYSLIEKKKRGGTPKTCHEAVRGTRGPCCKVWSRRVKRREEGSACSAVLSFF